MNVIFKRVRHRFVTTLCICRLYLISSAALGFLKYLRVFTLPCKYSYIKYVLFDLEIFGDGCRCQQ